MRFEAIGTAWQIDTASPIPPHVQTAIHSRIAEFDRTYSRFRDDSLVAAIERSAGVYGFPDDAGPLFDTYRRLYAATDGAMSPLVGQALTDLGYDRAYTLRDSGRRGGVPAWEDAIAWDGHTLTALRPVSVDVGAAGKGYLVDIVGSVLSEAGIAEFTIDASGDIVQRGSQPLRVGLEHPFDASKAIGVATITNQALCASATNRRAWGGGLHHVIDATTGLPTTRIIAAWAIAATGLEADGLSTALFFADPARLAQEFEFSYVRMFSTGRVEFSPDLQGEMFT